MYAEAGQLGALGDDSPADLFKQIIALRGQLQAARAARGLPDPWTLAGALAASGQASDYGQLSAGPSIAQEVLGLKVEPFAIARHDTKRGDWNAAIARMKSEIGQLTGATPAPAIPSPVSPTPLLPVTTTPAPSIATPAPAPALAPYPTAPAYPVATGTPSVTVTTGAPAAAAAGFDWQSYLPWALGGGVILLALAKRNSVKKVRA